MSALAYSVVNKLLLSSCQTSVYFVHVIYFTVINNSGLIEVTQTHVNIHDTTFIQGSVQALFFIKTLLTASFNVKHQRTMLKQRLRFSLPSIILVDISGNRSSLGTEQQAQKVRGLCDW